MDFSLPFSFPFKDPDWLKKLAIPGLILLIPIVGMLYVLGWALEITGQLIRHEPIIIPETDFGKFLTRGFKAWVISFVYSIPALILQAPGQIANVMAQNASYEDGNGAVVGGLATLVLCTSVLNLLYSLLLVFVLPAAYGLFMANNEEIGAGFRLGEIFALIKKVPVAFLLVWVGQIIAGVVGGLGVIACVVGLLITIPYASLIVSHFYGQVYLEASR